MSYIATNQLKSRQMKYKDKKSIIQHLEPFARARAKPEQRVSAKGLLGNATELRTPPNTIALNPFEYLDTSTGELQQIRKLSEQESISLAREQRFHLQDLSRSILYNLEDKPRINHKGYEVHHRTCTCNRFRLSETTEIVKTKNNKAFYRGLVQCADAKTCPVCASKISERKANEMRVAFNQQLALGKYVNLMTLTSSHTSSDDINTLISQQSDALSRFWRGEPAKRFKQKYGITGNIRSFEIKHGVNGWHPHFHILIFSDIPLPTDKNSDSFEWIFNRWVSCSTKSGLSKPNHYGLDIRNGDKAGDYITKFGSDDEILSTISGDKITWDIADEMTKGHVKTGGKSKTPFEILAAFESAETKAQKTFYKSLFIEYAKALKGKTLLKWSRGLRDKFGLGHQKTDEEIVNDEDSKADLLCHLNVEEWDYILKNNLRALILDMATKGGVSAVAQILSNSSILTFDEYLDDIQNRVSAHVDISPSLSISSPDLAINNFFDNEKYKIDLIQDKTITPLSPLSTSSSQRIRVYNGMKATPN